MNDLCGILALGEAPPRQEDLVRMAQALGVTSTPAAMVDSHCGLATIPRDRDAERECLLSLPAGSNQPVSIAFDGHAYNHRDVRAALDAVGMAFQTGSAAETILQSYRRFGPSNFIKAFRGPFVLALWDSAAGRLLLARDRLGQKPLYVAETKDWLLFASSTRSLLAHPDLSADLNQAVVPHYLVYGYPPQPETMLKGIQIVPPGHLLVAEWAGTGFHLTQDAYWQPPRTSADTDPRSDQNAGAGLLDRLRGALRLRMEDDQPPGMVLDGGLASTAVLALLTEETGRQVMTFSLSLNPESDFEARRFVRKVAARFVSDHTDMVVEPDVADVLDNLLTMYDQPIGDPTAIPSMLLFREAGASLPALFSGDGGNEVCGGTADLALAQLAQSYNHLPDVAQRAISEVMERLPETLAYAGFIRQANTVIKAADQPLAERYLSWVRLTPARWLTALLGQESEQAVTAHFRAVFGEASRPGDTDLVAALLDINLRTTLPANLLTRIDQGARSSRVDVRLPFLDHVVVSYAAALPSSLKLRRRSATNLLKQALRDRLPSFILERTPQGMSLPVDAWFRGELNGLVQEALIGPDARSRDVFDTAALSSMLDAHRQGKADLGYALWALLTFELWMRQTL